MKEKCTVKRRKETTRDQIPHVKKHGDGNTIT